MMTESVASTYSCFATLRTLEFSNLFFYEVTGFYVKNCICDNRQSCTYKFHDQVVFKYFLSSKFIRKRCWFIAMHFVSQQLFATVVNCRLSFISPMYRCCLIHNEKLWFLPYGKAGSCYCMAP